jgi:inner membrane protein
MFLALTFAVFFFVEIFTGKKIHPVQYLLVGLALILFYSLLLSFSERFGFEIAYLIASIATVGLITTYSYSIFKHKLQTAIMFLLLCILYTFLFVILRLEDTAFLIGSIGLFIILGVCMYISRKINWYKL